MWSYNLDLRDFSQTAEKNRELLTPKTVPNCLKIYEVTQTSLLNHHHHHHLFLEIVYPATDQKCIATQDKYLVSSQQQTTYWPSSWPAPVSTSWAALLAKFCSQVQHWNHFILRKLTQERYENVRKGRETNEQGQSELANYHGQRTVSKKEQFNHVEHLSS